MKYCCIAALSAMLLSLLAGYIGLPVLKKLRAGQTINELGPQSHMAKQGLLTMGGVGVMFSGLVTGIAFSFKNTNDHGLLAVFCAACGLAFGLIGFLDDYIKVVKKRSMGLSVKQKFAPQIIFALLIAIFAYFDKNIGPKIALPFTDYELNLGVFYIPVMCFAIVAIDNSANILDGLDGLLSSNASLSLAAMAAYSFFKGTATNNGSLLNVGIFLLCMSAAAFAFLKLNTHPAKVILGDVGSLGLGGCIAGAAVVTKGVLLIPFCCVTMLISSLSDILQLIYMKRHKGRKLFRMAPFHHHLELGGMAETQIVSLYSILTFIGSAVALILFC